LTKLTKLSATLCWGSFALCLALLLYALFDPAPVFGLFWQYDKEGHLLAFAGLAVTARLALVRCPGPVLWSGLLVTALVLESLQHLVQPVRSFSYEDMAANLAGVLLGGLLCWLRGRYRSVNP
jgi:hypothetical protein